MKEPDNKFMFLKGWEYFPREERENTDAENRHYAAANSIFDELNDGMRAAPCKLAKDEMKKSAHHDDLMS